MRYGGCPIIVPRVDSVSTMLAAYEPIHGVLLTEGEDIGLAFRPNENFPTEDVRRAHSSDSNPDPEKDRIEFALVHQCLQRNIPLLAICRGCQVVNIAAGGDLLPDLETTLGMSVRHIDYDNYDGHRHFVKVVPNTPLFEWFDCESRLSVNSYHHQGILNLADRFVPMAHADDGLVEAFYDPSCYEPKDGKFLIGFQFHPERMQSVQGALCGEKHLYDYPGCPRPHEEFVHAASVYCRKSATINSVRCATEALQGTEKLEEIDPTCLPFEAIKKGRGCQRHVHSAARLSRAHRMTNIQPAILGSKYDSEMGSTIVLSKRDLFLKTRSPVSRYSKEDLDRLHRSGASVHGTRLVYNLIHGKNTSNDENENENKRNTMTEDAKTLTSWKRFEKGLLQMERGLRGLESTVRMKDALEMVEKFSANFASVNRVHWREL